MEMECVEVECVETSGCVEMNPYQFPSASQILPPPSPLSSLSTCTCSCCPLLVWLYLKGHEVVITTEVGLGELHPFIDGIHRGWPRI